MRAAMFRAFNGDITIEEVANPAPPAHGVVVEVRATGVCRSDWHAWVGHDPTIELPHVPGHEMAGVVAGVGNEVRRWRLGDRVVVPFSCGCGACPTCRSGHTNLCDREYQPGFSGWGSFAELVSVPWADVNLAALPENISFGAAAALGCRFMTAFHALTDRVKLGQHDWVAVHGAGGVGLSAIQIARTLSARVVAVDVDRDKLDLAAELGAHVAVDGRREDPVRAIREATDGGAHVSIDALGAAETASNSIRCLRKRGTHVQIGLLLAEGRTVPLPMSRVISLELAVLGSHGMPASRYTDLFAMIADGGLEPERMIGRRIPLHEAPEAISAMGEFASRGVTVIEM